MLATGRGVRRAGIGALPMRLAIRPAQGPAGWTNPIRADDTGAAIFGC
jgi:hypothetical protein